MVAWVGWCSVKVGVGCGGSRDGEGDDVGEGVMVVTMVVGAGWWRGGDGVVFDDWDDEDGGGVKRLWRQQWW
ncbi:hypothetical protein Tco_0473878 [Tanacetum coccineum]